MTAPQPSGFLSVNLSVGFLRDPKVRAAARAGGSDAVVAYLALLLASWEQGDRVTLEDAAGALPRDYPDGVTEQSAVLEDAGLTDGGRIPDAAFAKHYGTARVRADRQHRQRSEAGRKGGSAPRREAPAKRSLSDRLAEGATDRQTDDDTNVSSVGLSPVRPVNGTDGQATPAGADDDDWVFDPAMLNGVGGYRRATHD